MRPAVTLASRTIQRRLASSATRTYQYSAQHQADWGKQLRRVSVQIPTYAVGISMMLGWPMAIRYGEEQWALRQ
ncbi:hypothetical protein GMORB2_2058 [Geosmithia morbida]|uniref:Cytochrome c oxidase subunit VIIc n=1 Tax=Geosmithia morbida TaxID=1094350 RepID=A0A9P4YRY8_9HYPO|nr:uncharacterized protein GMORB2_2058 [Geosmithia morbida]KAF4121650.1 hypothetical protein GMORB2_2058 [Geosmithia morbida]